MIPANIIYISAQKYVQLVLMVSYWLHDTKSSATVTSSPASNISM